MKRLISVLILTLIIPQVAFAAWWNPFSWKVFKTTDPKTQILENRVKELEDKLANTPTSTPSTPPPTSKPDLKTSVSNTPSQATQPKKSSVPEVQSTQTQVDTNLFYCNGKNYRNDCPYGKKPFCSAEKVGCYSDAEINAIQSGTSYCNGKYYASCPSGTSLSCPANGGAGVCIKTKQQRENDSYQAVIDEIDRKEQARKQAEEERQNSPECILAKDNLSKIQAERKPIEDKLTAYSDEYLLTGKYDTSAEKRDLTSKSADLAIRESGLYNKKLAACDNFYPTPPKIYNTNCYSLGGSVQCYTQ